MRSFIVKTGPGNGVSSTTMTRHRVAVPTRSHMNLGITSFIEISLTRDDGFKGGVFCNEDNILRRNGSGIEHEADQFAANLLMPLNDFRKQDSGSGRAKFRRS